MLKIILISLAILISTIIATRTYSQYQKDKATQIDACYYRGKIYKTGEHYKACNNCICNLNRLTDDPLAIQCYDMACPGSFFETPVMDKIISIFLVK